MNYKVIVCPDKYCRGITIIRKETKTTTCRECDKSYDLEDYKISYETNNHEEAIEARTQLLLKRNDESEENIGEFTTRTISKKETDKESYFS